MALIKNFGIAGIGQSVQYGKGGGKVVYDTSNSMFKITTNDGSTLANVAVETTPTNINHATSKAYVDSVAQGLDVKESVRAASTGSITITSPGSTIDGVNLLQGDRILLKDQATATQNGIWVWASAVAPLVRAIDMDATGEFTGSFFFVEEGIVNSDQGFVCTTNGTVTVDSTAVEFSQFTGTGQLTAGDGLSKVGNKIDVNVDNTFVEVDANDALTIKGTFVTGEVLKSDGNGSVEYGALDITNGNAIAGALPLANGGLGVDASNTAGKTTARTNLGLGTMATQDASNVAITGGSVDLSASGQLILANDQLSGDVISGGTIDGTTLLGAAGNKIEGYDITVGAQKKLAVTGNFDVDGDATSAMDGVTIGATTPANGTFTLVTSNTVDLNGGAIDGTAIGNAVAESGKFTNLSANAVFKADNVEAFTPSGDITFNSKIIAAAGIDFGGASTTSTGITADTVDEKTLDLGVTVDSVLLKDAGVTATGTSNLTTATIGTATINGGTMDAVTIGGTTPAAGTFTTMTTDGAVITGGTIENTDVDVTGQTLSLDDNQISGDKIDGGLISDFASQGIDDNVTPLGTVEDGETRETTTILTLADTNAKFDTNLIVNGDLTVTGTTTTVNSTDTLVADNLITLNAGETAAGVTSGAAGIEVDRGTEDNASLQWNEVDDVWEFKVGTALADLKIGSQAMDSIAVDNIGELSPGAGITFDNAVAGSDATFSGTVTVDTIAEYNTDAGVTVDSVHLKDGVVTAGLTAELGDTVDVSAANLVLTDDQISGDKVEGGTINEITINTLTSTAVDIDGGNIDGTIIGAAVPAAGTFSAMTTGGADINGGNIDGTIIGAAVPAAGTFARLDTANAQITGGAISGADLTSSTVDFGGGEMDGVKIGDNVPAEGTFSTLTSNNVALTGGTATGMTTVSATDLNSGNVTITGGTITGTDIDLGGVGITFEDDQISGDSIHAGTISNSSLTGQIHNGTDPHSTISRYDITVGANFALDVSTGTLTLAADQISGDKVHGGTISNFASTGIDDDATATKMTLTDAAVTFGVPGTFGTNTLAAGATTLASATVTGDAVIQGNLTVSGAVTTTQSETVTIADNIIELNSNVASNTAPTEDSGLEVNRGNEHNAKWYWDENLDVWSSKDANGTMANISVGEIQAASFGLSGTIATTDGGTGTDTSTFADDSLMKMSGSGTGVTAIPKGGNSTVLKVNSSGNLGYAKVELSADVSDVNGVLPIANGGTGLSSNGLAHQVLIADGAGALAYGYQETLRTSLGDVAIQTSGMATAEYLDMSSATGSVTLTAKNVGGTGVVDMYLQGQDGGDVFLVGQSGEAVLQGDDDTDLTVSGGVSVAGDAGDLVLKGGNGSSTFASGDVIIKGGTGGTAEGKTQVYGSNDRLIATFVETADSDTTVDSLEIKNGTGGIELAAVGDSAEVNLVLAPKTADKSNGTGGMVMLPADTEIDFATSDDMVVSTKKYVDDEIAKVGDNFIRRAFAANGDSTFTIGNIKDVSGKDYYVKSVTIKITAAFVGCDEITVSDGTNTLVSPLDVDMSETGLFIIEQGYENTTAQNATITATLGLGGSTVSPITGNAIISVEYKAINQ